MDGRNKRFIIKGIHPESDSEWFEAQSFDSLDEAEAYVCTLDLIDSGFGHYEVVDTQGAAMDNTCF